ncbi:MAG: glycosyltransferase family 39 protein, partial [Bryobacteraceae bacterium]
DAEVTRLVRLRRTIIVGAAAFLLSAFQLIPLLLDHSTISHSRWEPMWKWDSFGALQVTKWLFTGELLDHGRLPILTLLALGGAALVLWNRRQQTACAVYSFVLLGAAFWTLLFFGRPFWGPLLTMLGVSADMQLHRVIGAAQIFLVLLGGIALAAIWIQLSRRWHFLAAIVATALLLYPLIEERSRNLSNDATWGQRNLDAHAAEQQALDQTIAIVKERGGRAYSGLAASWGGQFKVGDVPFYAAFSVANIPAVAFLFHSMALTGDVMVRFNEWDQSQYRLFNIHTVVAPVDLNVPLPPFLRQIGQNGRFRIFEAPGDSYFDVVDVLASVKTSKDDFYDINDRWLQSDWVGKRLHLWLDWHEEAPKQFLRLAVENPLPQIPMLPSPGKVLSEQRNGEVYQAEIEAVRPGYTLFKMTWHANWKTYIDGKLAKIIMVSPGFMAAAVPAGRHEIVFRYEPGRLKIVWGFTGLLAVMLLFAGERRGLLARPVEWNFPARKLWIAGGLILLSLPVCIPLFTGGVLWGHDGFVYFPRLIEVHQNFIHGILLPRWAPDLGRGTGQPLFVFHPPMIYYFGELWHLMGIDVVTSMNLACVLVVLASAGSMFLLARLYFGEAGGWLGAAAYLYAPYFAVDLYVRSAMEEFAAFPFFALALFGFGAYARRRSRRYWLIGVAAYACLLFCHFPGSLLFTPLLLGFLVFTAWDEKSWKVLAIQTYGFLLGLGLSALIWMPALAARQDVFMNRAVEGTPYSSHFVYLHQLFYSPWGYGLSVAGPNDGMSFALGWSHLLLIAAVWIWISRTSKPVGRGLLRFFSAAAVLLCILMLQDALWFWDHLTLIQFVQFPWRLLGPVTLCVALLIAPLGGLLTSVPRWRVIGFWTAMALLIVPNLSHLHPRQVADVDLTFWTPQQLSIRGFDTTSMGEVEPRWILGLPAYTPFAATVLTGDAEIQSPLRTPFSWSSSVNAKIASGIEVNTAWFPGWEVRIDGRKVDAAPGRPSGLIAFSVPQGSHSVNVEYKRTATEKVAIGISIAALILIAGSLSLLKKPTSP